MSAALGYCGGGAYIAIALDLLETITSCALAAVGSAKMIVIAKATRLAGFIDCPDFATDSGAPSPDCPHQLIQAGRINGRRLRLTCAASPEAFDIVEAKEWLSSVGRFADGLP
jgi:hypothetical protein